MNPPTSHAFEQAMRKVNSNFRPTANAFEKDASGRYKSIYTDIAYDAWNASRAAVVEEIKAVDAVELRKAFSSAPWHEASLEAVRARLLRDITPPASDEGRPDKDGWIPYTIGDPMPVDGGTAVEVKFHAGDTGKGYAVNWRWHLLPGFTRPQPGDIIAYRVIAPAPAKEGEVDLVKDGEIYGWLNSLPRSTKDLEKRINARHAERMSALQQQLKEVEKERDGWKEAADMLDMDVKGFVAKLTTATQEAERLRGEVSAWKNAVEEILLSRDSARADLAAAQKQLAGLEKRLESAQDLIVRHHVMVQSGTCCPVCSPKGKDSSLFTHAMYGSPPPAPEVKAEAWKLPEPPDGREWHRGSEFTEEDLKGGWRPLFSGEEIQEGDEVWHAGRGPWMEQSDTFVGGFVANMTWNKHRTLRPLPAQPVAEEWVPLGSEDVPPGSVFRVTVERDGFDTPSNVNSSGVAFAHRLSKRFSWQRLMEDFEISTDQGRTWSPARKPLNPKV